MGLASASNFARVVVVQMETVKILIFEVPVQMEAHTGWHPCTWQFSGRQVSWYYCIIVMCTTNFFRSINVSLLSLCMSYGI